MPDGGIQCLRLPTSHPARSARTSSRSEAPACITTVADVMILGAAECPERLVRIRRDDVTAAFGEQFPGIVLDRSLGLRTQQVMHLLRQIDAEQRLVARLRHRLANIRAERLPAEVRDILFRLLDVLVLSEQQKRPPDILADVRLLGGHDGTAGDRIEALTKPLLHELIVGVVGSFFRRIKHGERSQQKRQDEMGKKFS